MAARHREPHSTIPVPSGFSLLFISSISRLVELLAQPAQASLPYETDRTRGQAETAGDLLIGTSWFLKEEHVNQFTAPPGKRGQHLSQMLVPLRLAQDLLRFRWNCLFEGFSG